MNISNYENIADFNSEEFCERLSKTANFKGLKQRMQVGYVDFMSSKNIDSYEKKNKKLEDKFDKYAPATTPAPFGSNTKELKNVSKIIKNLDIIFTPFGVIITTKNGAKKLSIQTIKFSEMNSEMQAAYKSQNADYFKRYMSAMMMYEAQNVKNQMAIDSIKKSLEFQDTLTKGASELLDEYDDDIPFFNILFYGEKYEELSDDVFQKLAACSIIEDEVEYVPTSDKEGFLELCKAAKTIPDIVTDGMYKEAICYTPDAITKNGKVQILADRVVFFIGDKVLTSIFFRDMSEEQKEHFVASDKKYFKDMLCRQALLYNQRRTYYGMNKTTEKKAGAGKIFSLSSIFTLDFIHPYIYYLTLSQKLGKNWTDFDEFVIIKLIEDKFKVPIIANSALNKVLSISALNSKETNLATTSTHAFEKIARSFLDLPINFEEKETDSLDAKSIEYALECMAACYNEKESLYEKLSPDVLSYIVNILTEDDMYAFYPAPTSLSDKDSEAYLEFLSKVNTALLDTMIKRDTDVLVDRQKEEEVSASDEIIQSAVVGTLDILRSGEANDVGFLEKYVADFCKNAGVEERFADIIKTQVERNLGIDVYIKKKDNTLNTYMSIFGFKEE